MADSEQLAPEQPAPEQAVPEPLDAERPDPQRLDSVLQDIALVLAHNLPPGWQECLAVHSALGSHAETTVRIQRLGGGSADVAGPEVLGELFARLRAGGYRPGVGTWFTARFRMTHPVDYRVAYDASEQPDWSAPPPPEAYDDELRRFPRDAEHTPDWLRRPAARFQMARVFDSLGPGQTPRFDRPPVPDDEVEAVADYLTRAPMVLAARSLDNDLLDPARPEKVPLTYLTDGTWIWPGAVGYYLRTHGVPPEPELVEHIRRQGYQPPEVDDHTRDVAVATIMGQPPPARPGPPQPLQLPDDREPPPTEPAPEPPAEPPVPGERAAASAAPLEGEARSEAGDVGGEGDGEVAVGSDPESGAVGEGETQPAAGPLVSGDRAAASAAPLEDEARSAVDDAGVDADSGVAVGPDAESGTAGEGETRPAAGRPASAAEPASPADTLVSKLDPLALELHARPQGPDGPASGPGTEPFDRLRDRLAEAGIDPASYGIEAVVEGAWCLVRAGDGWAVFRDAGGEQAERVAFPSAGQAAAYLLGSLLMAEPPAAAPAPTYEGAIEPLPGEPPFTLFRNLRELELVPGTEIDRVGDPGGNLAYAAGTPYNQRSLPAEWADRPYHAYRVMRPLRALVGTAIPWFDQPGGGTGYFLPVSAGQLLVDGVLVEIELPPK